MYVFKYVYLNCSIGLGTMSCGLDMLGCVFYEQAVKLWGNGHERVTPPKKLQNFIEHTGVS